MLKYNQLIGAWFEYLRHELNLIFKIYSYGYVNFTYWLMNYPAHLINRSLLSQFPIFPLGSF